MGEGKIKKGCIISALEQDISRGIVFYGRMRVKTRRVSKKRMIMIMTV